MKTLILDMSEILDNTYIDKFLLVALIYFITDHCIRNCIRIISGDCGNLFFTENILKVF